jgi:DNA polymerase
MNKDRSSKEKRRLPERSQELISLEEEIKTCYRCPLAGGRTKTVPGEGPGRAGLLLVGEAPGKDEDRAGLPFVGRAGSVLDRALKEAGIDRAEVFITNVVKCRPPDNRRPKKEEVEACRPYLESQIEIVGPKVVILMGNAATKAVLGVEGVTNLRGQLFSDLFLVTFHPAAVLRNRDLEGALVSDLSAARYRAKILRGSADDGGGSDLPGGQGAFSTEKRDSTFESARGRESI